MMSHCRTAALALAALLLAFAIQLPVGEALAEEPDPDPDPELQADDAAEDEEPPVEEEPVDDPDEADEPDATDEEDDDVEVDAGTDDFDDDWAEDVVAVESDDAIPADLELNPTGEEWFVTGFEDDGDNQEEGAEPREGDLRDSADMPVIRRPSPGAKPVQSARPGKPGLASWLGSLSP